MFTQKHFEILIDNLESVQQGQLEDILICFPFQNILNINILDFEVLRTHLNFLKKLSKLDTFYKFTETVTCCWEFTLTNLLSLENLPVDDILFGLLELLKHLISKMKMINKFTSHLRNQRERVFNALTFAANLKIFGTCHVSNHTDILVELIEMDESLPPAAVKSLADIAEIYKDLQVVPEMVLLCDVFLKKSTSSAELYNIYILWLLVNGPGLLEENGEENNVFLLLKVITELYTNFNYFGNAKAEEFKANLKKVSHRLISLSAKPTLRDESLKLFSVLLSEYYSQEMNFEKEYPTVLNNLLGLPIDVKQWPSVKSNIFFYICSYLYSHSSLPWNSQEILQSMSGLVYSYDRFAINRAHLKTLCHIYPIAMADDKPCQSTLILGDELLIILSKFPYSLSKILTYHPAQLVWMLRRGCGYVKKHVLLEWLKRDEDLDFLGKAILKCRVGNVLLDVITDWKFDELANRASEMCHRIQDKELSGKVAYIIPTVLTNKRMLGRLMLSNPGVPGNPEMALKICEFMSLILCLIDDTEVLKAACVYSKYLVTTLKNERNIADLFCRNMKNIQFLTLKVKYVGEETAIEILRLLKVLMLVQQRNRNVLSSQVDADPSSWLVGSAVKTEKCLDILQIIVTSKGVFITVEKSKILNIFLNLFNMTRNPKFSVKSIICLTGILKANGWLACIPSTNAFVEIQCSLSVDQRSGPEFLTFLTVWIKALNSCTYPNIIYLPDRRIVSNYIKRVGFIPHKKVKYLLHMVNNMNLFAGN